MTEILPLISYNHSSSFATKSRARRSCPSKQSHTSWHESAIANVSRHRKLTRRLEELIQGSSAVKPQFVAELMKLGNKVNELVDFGPNVIFISLW